MDKGKRSNSISESMRKLSTRWWTDVEIDKETDAMTWLLWRADTHGTFPCVRKLRTWQLSYGAHGSAASAKGASRSGPLPRPAKGPIGPQGPQGGPGPILGPRGPKMGGKWAPRAPLGPARHARRAPGPPGHTRPRPEPDPAGSGPKPAFRRPAGGLPGPAGGQIWPDLASGRPDVALPGHRGA